MGESFIPEIGEDELSEMMNRNFENTSFSLSEWQRSNLENITAVGIQCLIYMWFTVQPKLELGNCYDVYFIIRLYSVNIHI